ncbi:hypothetical protein pb186bvf_003588 [Paramecium bursaria]
MAQEIKVSSEYWQQLNQTYFISEAPIDLNQQNLTKSILPNYPNQIVASQVERILKPYSRDNLLNLRNLKKRICLQLIERPQQDGAIENLLDQMIDTLQYKNIVESLQDAQDTLRQNQPNSLKKEQAILNRARSQVQYQDELYKAIKDFKLELKPIETENQQMIQTLSQSQMQQYTYKAFQTGETSLRLSKQRVLDEIQKEEIRLVKEIIISYQNRQISESIVKAQFDQDNNQINLKVDSCIKIDSFQVSLDQWHELQKIRDVKYELEEKHKLRTDYQFCHFCRQLVDERNVRQCTYNHQIYGLHEFNEDILTEQRFKISKQKKDQYMQDLYTSNYIVEDDRILCKRYFCQQCLKYDFENDIQVEINWLCPLCKGRCTCSRCIRNDMIYKLKRCYLEMGGDLQELYDQSLFERLVVGKRLSMPMEVEQETLCIRKKSIHKFHRHDSSSKSGKFEQSSIESFTEKKEKIKRSREINNLAGSDYPVEFLLGN